MRTKLCDFFTWPSTSLTGSLRYLFLPIHIVVIHNLHPITLTKITIFQKFVAFGSCSLTVRAGCSFQEICFNSFAMVHIFNWYRHCNFQRFILSTWPTISLIYTYQWFSQPYSSAQSSWSYPFHIFHIKFSAFHCLKLYRLHYH